MLARTPTGQNWVQSGLLAVMTRNHQSPRYHPGWVEATNRRRNFAGPALTPGDLTRGCTGSIRAALRVIGSGRSPLLQPDGYGQRSFVSDGHRLRGTADTGSRAPPTVFGRKRGWPALYARSGPTPHPLEKRDSLPRTRVTGATSVMTLGHERTLPLPFRL